MFRKKPTIKALAPLRSSDRRKLADEINSLFHFTNRSSSGLSTDDAEDEEAIRQRAELRKTICPENLQAARFTTTRGPDLKLVSGTIYVGGDGPTPRVLWFRVFDRLFPTVYTLWRFPDAVARLYTADIVIAKLQGGADLMCPGLGNGPPFDSRAKTGAIAAVASVSSPHQLMAVGTCVVDVCALESVQGTKGPALETIHAEGDELWSFSPAGQTGVHYEEFVARVPKEPRSLTDQTADLSLEVIGDPPATKTDPELTTKLSTKEIDEAFKNAFLYAIHDHKKHAASEQGLNLPLTQSATMTLIQPFLPIRNVNDATHFQIKNSSYKNIKKFIKSLDKDGLVKSKERDKHETVIIDIDYNDTRITSFKPYPLSSKTSADPAEASSVTNDTTTSSIVDPSIGQKLEIVQLYKVPAAFAALTQTTESKTALTQTQFRAYLISYLESANLFVDTKDKRSVKYVPELITSLGSSAAGEHDAELLAKAQSHSTRYSHAS